MSDQKVNDLVSVDREKFDRVCELSAGLSNRVKEIQDRYSDTDRKVGDFKAETGEIKKRLDEVVEAQKSLQMAVAERKTKFVGDGEDSAEDLHRTVLAEHAAALVALRVSGGKAMFDRALDTITARFGLSRDIVNNIVNSRVTGAGQYPARYRDIRRGAADQNANEEILAGAMQRAMDTQTTAEGADWVYATLMNDLIRSFRQVNTVVANLRSFDMERAQMRLNKMGADPTWYSVAENTGDTGTKIGASTPGTAALELDAQKMAARWLSSYELEVDSTVALAPVLREMGIASANNALAYVLVRGDEAAGASANINKNDGTPTTTAGARSLYLTCDGIHKYCIDGVTNNGNSLVGATYDVATLTFAAGSDDLIAMRNLLTEGKGVSTADLMVLANNTGYMKMLDAAGGVKTLDTFGPNAVILTGQLAMVAGIPIVVEGQIPDTENGQTGEIITTPSTVKGNITLIHRPSFLVGFAPIKGANRVLIETMSDIETQQDIVVMSVRPDIIPLRSGAAVLGYDID